MSLLKSFAVYAILLLLSKVDNFIIAKKISVSREFFGGCLSLVGEILIAIVAPSFIEGQVRGQYLPAGRQECRRYGEKLHSRRLSIADELQDLRELDK